MFGGIKRFFQQRALSQFTANVVAVAALEAEIRALSDDEITARSHDLRSRIAGTLNEETVIEAFALAREAARRTLGQRPYDVQILGGLVLQKGAVAEMATGEGKTLAGVAPAYANALTGRGVHVVTVNEYLARRDAVWMGQVYRLLGLSVACLTPAGAFLYDPTWHIPEGEQTTIDKERDSTGSFLVQQEYLRPIARREAYLADITYGTNHEFGFDFLRDNLAYSLEQQVQRKPYFAIIDEVDSILIDEARTPLIISAPDAEASDSYRTFARLAKNLIPDEDYTLDEKLRSVAMTESGIMKIERAVGVPNLYAPEHIRLVHYLEESLKATALFKRDKDYVVKDGRVIIVDEFTGRMLHGRRYNSGLHQAIEAKEGVTVQQESRTYAKISIQNYFRLYEKISGMTGTAQTSAEEFHKVYNLEVFSIPTNKPTARQDAQDLIYKNFDAKMQAVAADVKARREAGQPVLIGSTSIEKNEIISSYLSRAGVPHEVLNAKNNEREGAIIAQAGRLKAVTVATNVAGRGVDIILGGNPPEAEEAQKVRELGGLCVIGTERHEARRIDNQLRGRSGRQGDPGFSQFYLSLEDDLLRIFGGDRIKGMMERFNLPEDQPIQMSFVSSAVAEAQSKVEGANFDVRKHLLEYDDVLNKQRSAVYARRQQIIEAYDKEKVAEMIRMVSLDHLDVVLHQQPAQVQENTESDIPPLAGILREAGIADKNNIVHDDIDIEAARRLIEKRAQDAAADPQTLYRLLSILDMLWMNHLEDLDALSESVGLRAYGQRDPLIEYRREANQIYKNFWANFNGWVFSNMFKMVQTSGISQATVQPVSAAPAAVLPSGSRTVGRPAVAEVKTGRNDPCPCGSGKKYKKCGLINTEEHRKNMASGGKKHEVTGG